MATFVLVHGAYHGGWCWRRVLDRLTANGHRAFAPSLTGLAERSHLASPAVDLDTHIADIANLLRWEGLSDVVLCGHSYGGMVVTGAADREAGRVAALVYLDALGPSDGQSAMQVVLPDRAAGIRNSAAGNDGWRAPPPSAASFGVIDPADQAWVDELCTPQPIATLMQPIRLTGQLDRVKRRHYILAKRYDPSAFHGFAARFRADPAWRVDELDTGHDAMVTMPKEVADLLGASAR